MGNVLADIVLNPSATIPLDHSSEELDDDDNLLRLLLLLIDPMLLRGNSTIDTVKSERRILGKGSSIERRSTIVVSLYSEKCVSGARVTSDLVKV